MPGAIPAATLIIVRDHPQGHEVLMIERHVQLAFAGGAAVFPGGRVDEDDRLVAGDPALCAAPPGIDPGDAAARVAAIRESLEEAGVAIAVNGIGAATCRRWREALHNATAFSRLLAEDGAVLDLGLLTPFARWRPGETLSRMFDTRFYLARAPEDATESCDADADADADGDETTRIFWTRPAALLAAADRGEAHIIFPTRRNLERLAAHQDYAALADHARMTPVTTITPWIEHREGEDWRVIPEGLGYPVTAAPVANTRRG